MEIVDLHVHSNKSDGSFSPTALVEMAVAKGLSAFALTDHDTTEGLQEAIEAAQSTSVKVIPGIEFSTEYEGSDVHILGLDLNYQTPAFQNHLQAFQDSRILRNQKMCKKLRGAGIEITYESLLEAFPERVLTRSHYAQYLLNHGYIRNVKEAFERFIGDDCPYFIPREKVTPKQAIALVIEAKGIPVLAHPTLYGFGKEKLSGLVASLKADGLMGIEAIYSTYTPQEERRIKSLAKEYDLGISGGSDFHGNVKPGLELATGYGRLMVPLYIWQDLQQRQALAYNSVSGTKV